MNGWAWAVLAWLFLTLLLNLRNIGKPRPPKTAKDAIYATIEVVIVGILVVLAATT